MITKTQDSYLSLLNYKKQSDWLHFYLNYLSSQQRVEHCDNERKIIKEHINKYNSNKFKVFFFTPVIDKILKQLYENKVKYKYKCCCNTM